MHVCSHAQHTQEGRNVGKEVLFKGIVSVRKFPMHHLVHLESINSGCGRDLDHVSLAKNGKISAYILTQYL